MPRVLAVSDEERPGLRVSGARPELILSAGDLPSDYLEVLVDTYRVPLVYVPGNHDPDRSGLKLSRSGLLLRAGLPTADPGPGGGEDADARVVDAGGLRIAGLGGCLRYRAGPNQYTERQQRRRAGRVLRAAERLRRRDGRGVDVLLTHAPPLGVGDEPDDPVHRGFEAFHALVRELQPRFLLHGHVHPYGRRAPVRVLGQTHVINVVGSRVLVIGTRVAVTAGR